MPVLFKISAKGCSACTKLNSHWSLTRQNIQDMGITVMEVELKSIMERMDPAKYPSSIVKSIRFFPTIFMMSGDTWRRCDEKWNKDNVLVLNGSIDLRGVIVSKKGGYTVSSSESVMSWVADCLSHLGSSKSEVKKEPKKDAGTVVRSSSSVRAPEIVHGSRGSSGSHGTHGTHGDSKSRKHSEKKGIVFMAQYY